MAGNAALTLDFGTISLQQEALQFDLDIAATFCCCFRYCWKLNTLRSKQLRTCIQNLK